MKRNNNIIKIFALIALQFLIINNVYAAGFFTPNDGDLSITVLKKLFGGLMGGGSDPLQDAIKIFNSSILIIGGILVAYTIVMGTVGTAHEGEMMGKKFSSVWVPIRTALGTALVLPTVNGAYCLMQSIVMWLILQGVGLADAVWTSYVGRAALGANVSASMQSKDKMMGLAESIFQMQVCLEANKQALAKVAEDTPQFKNIVDDYDYTYKLEPPKPGDKEKVWMFGDFKKKFLFSGKKDCGTITVQVPPEENTNTRNEELSNFQNKLKMPPLTPIYQAHDKATSKLIEDIQPLAKEFVKEIINPSETGQKAEIDYDKLRQLVDAYEATVLSAGESYIRQTEPFKYLQETAEKEGWFMAGSWFIKLININASTSASINNTPVGAPNQGVVGRNTGLMIRNVYDAMTLSMDRATNQTRNLETYKEEEEALGSSGKLMNAISKLVVGIKLTELRDDNRHPIILVQEMGNRITTSYSSAVLGVAAVAGGIGILQGSGVGIVFTILTMTFPVLVVLMFLSFFLGYFLPMLPFMIWMGAISGWLILVIEAVIAAPLWAVMHLHPNGDDATGKGGSGYMLILGLLLRPTLMVFGFISSVALLQVMGEFVNKVFFDVFALSQNGTIGLFGITFGILVYAVVMFQLIKTMLSVIHVVPDQLLKWIGGGTEQLGNYANNMTEGTKVAYAALANKMTENVGALPGQVMDVKNQMKSLKHAADGIANEKIQTGMMEQSEKTQLDNTYGPGTAEDRKDVMGIQEIGESKGGDFKTQSFDNQRKQAAFKSGLDKSIQAGGDEAKEDFISQMKESSMMGHRDYGGSSINAAQSIGEKVSNQYMLNNISDKFGPDFAEQAGITNGGGEVADQNKLNKLGSALSKYEAQIGPTKLDGAIQKTLNENPPNTPTSDLLKSLSNNVKQIKSEIGKPKIQEENPPPPPPPPPSED